jgi:transcriptional regulator with XRE-family HTH domain
VEATPRGANATASFINGALVARIARQRGWKTVDEIVNGLGLGSRATYHRYLNGTQEPSLSRARLVAANAGLPLDEVFPPAQLAA